MSNDLFISFFFVYFTSLETGPPTRTQPQSTINDGWRKVTLTVPNGKNINDGDLGEAPIAPPRRKRSTIVDRQPCGFKELFGNNVSRRSSCDSILKGDNPLNEREQEMLQQKRKSKSISDFNLNEIKSTDSLSISTIRIPVTRTLSMMERAMAQQSTIPQPRPTLQRKVSRVGNKKSDKFFGENLSDCLSDDPITPEPEPAPISFTYHTISTLITPISHTTVGSKDKLDDFIDSNVTTIATVYDNKSVDGTDVGEVTIPATKQILTSDRIETKSSIADDKKSSLDKKAEFLMAMLEGNNSYKPVEEIRVMTPPRRSHLKKRNSQSLGSDSLSSSENSTPVHTNQEKITEKKSTVLNSTEAKNKFEYTNNDDEEYYKGMCPVEEPLIVPRKRPTKHICDDDHHIQKFIEQNHTSPKENKENQPTQSMKDEDIEKYIIRQVTCSPEKPKRDFSVYEKSHQTTTIKPTPATTILPNENEEKPTKQIARVRHLSQENLMSNKILTSKSNDTIDLLRLKSIQNANTNTDKTNGDDRLESILKKYTSQQSFFTQELLSQIADRVYGFQDPFETSGSCDDGSSKCTPNSKLTTRKISAHRKESTITRPILENVLEFSSNAAEPKIVQTEHKSISSGNLIDNLINEKPLVESKIELKPIFNDEKTKSDTENFLSIERKNSIVCEKSEAVIKDFEKIVTKQPLLSLSVFEVEPINDVSNSNNVLNDIYENNNKILDEFQQNFNGIISMEQSKICDKSENLNSSDDENTDSDVTVKEVPLVESADLNINNKKLTQLNGGVKRGSIVEVESWFLKHNDLSNLPRRGSETYTGYDTRKVFPFGKSDPGAGTEFFESKSLSKSAENILNDNITKIELTTDQNGNSNENPSTDHSILLKYLK